MVAQILPFPKAGQPTASPVACFMRVGDAHRKLADLHAAGHLPARRAVIEASRFRHQRELVTALRESGAEIILDTEAAELAALAKCQGQPRHAPWAPKGGNGVLGPDAFRDQPLTALVGEIARFAVENSVTAILAPTHFLGDPNCRDWLSIDRETCFELRAALDREGGELIGIDFPVIIPNTMLNDAASRGAIVSALDDLPIENVWVRSSGFGSDAGPLAVSRYLSSVSSFHNLGKPVVADYLGGIVGLAALAFGAVSGLAVGTGERERFDGRSWHKPPAPRTEDSASGRTVRVAIPGMHRSVTLKELDVLVSAKGGRRLCGCSDRACCPHGPDDMAADHRRHTARQLFKSLSGLEAVPDLRRETHFLNGPMQDADKLARQVKALRPSQAEGARLKIDVDELMKRMADHSRNIEKLRSTLEHLHEQRGEEGPRARAVEARKQADGRASQTRP